MKLAKLPFHLVLKLLSFNVLSCREEQCLRSLPRDCLGQETPVNIWKQWHYKYVIFITSWASCSGGLRPLVELCVEPAGWQDSLEEGMVTHSNILAWGILWTEEPGGLQSKGSQRVGHSWSNLACIHACFTSFAKVIYVYCDILGIMEIKNNDGEKNTIMILIPGNKSY